MENAEWYVDWFNSPYYHLLYNHRNDREAISFIDHLCSKLDLKPHYKIWDLACGKGRHAIALNKNGFDVIGTDLAENSIREASGFSNPTLEFLVHDMRDPFKENFFDAVFNVFTSLGYFKDFQDNFLVFENVARSLKKEGEFVVDFFNAERVLSSFKSDYVEQRGNITFEIRKVIANNAIIKHIEFNSGEKNYYFEESVSLLRKEHFLQFAERAGLTLHHTFGNYKLEAFDEKTSERLILIFKK
ncbi:MAG: methyltransferase domain-containing protein [bacterium]|nr:methyltransferase domain-containing protein [bacterium]